VLCAPVRFEEEAGQILLERCHLGIPQTICHHFAAKIFFRL
jgi:hypothetical protein